MTWLTRLNPTPAFPTYTGPYKVGSIDVEIPTTELGDSEKKQPTIAFRVFYPCRDNAKAPGVRWLPSPQREYIGAYARFLGAGNAFSQMFSLLPQLLSFVSIPVQANADLLEPCTPSKRWPVMVFSHGLGGSRNAYSHICGSLASHGMVVFAPDHRDGSAPISFVHTPEEKEKLKRVEYKKVAHQASTEVYEARDEQLRIRLWELSLLHTAILHLDAGHPLVNVAEAADTKTLTPLPMFASKLNVHTPGSISFAGHSFGAATTVQFVKSIFYRASPSAPPSYTPLLTLPDSSPLTTQITPATPILLLDLWALPIQSPTTSWLKSQPLPCYAAPHGASNLLAILSEAFFKWTSNLNDTKRILAPPPSSGKPGPHIFYPIASAHLSQSDFGILFPWVTTKVFGAKEPERVLRLNTRAILQVLREAGVEVSGTRKEDLEAGEGGEGVGKDEWILRRKEDSVRGWIYLGAEREAGGTREVEKGPGGAVVEGEVLGSVVSEGERGGG